MIFKADLHMHSNCSDGTLSPKQLIDEAHQKQIAAISITDHDCVDAYNEELFKYAKEKNVQLVPGVEFSAMERDVSVHILGYFIDWKNKDLLEFCKKHIRRREKRNRAILALLKAQNMPIDEEELKAMKSAPLGRPHIAELMIKKGYVSDYQEAFHKYLGDGKLCYAHGENVAVEDTIEIIHHVKGLAFLAHPHLLLPKKAIKWLLDMPFDGVEGYYGNQPKNIERSIIEKANNKNLLISGGSDYHGGRKAFIQMGCSWIDERAFAKICERRQYLLG